MKKNVKKLLCLAMSAVLSILCFTSCNSASDSIYRIGICQLVQHEALDAATKGFKDALTEKLGDKVIFDEQNASGESTNCTTIVSKFVTDNVDLIMANATAALTAAAEATEEIPVVATSITDYATALGMQNWTGITGFNVTGTSDLAPLADQAAMLKEIVPNAKAVGILYCSAEPNSKYQADVITDEFNKLGINNVKTYTFVDTNDVTSITQLAVNECDVIYIPTDNTAANNAAAINNIAEPAGIPIIAGESGICKGCGIATLSIDYYDIGYRAGEMAYDILVNGKDPASMPIETTAETSKQYVASRASALNIAVPEGYEAIIEE